MNTKVLIAIGLIGLLLAVGALVYFRWPNPVPHFQVAGESGQPVEFEALFDDKDYMLVVFLLPSCQVSKFSSTIVNEQHAQFSDRMSFVGLIFGNYADGQKYAQGENLTFPVYGLKDAPDPFAVQELVKVVGKAHGLGSAVYGGTIVVLDRKGKIVFQLEKESVRDLPKRLGSGR
jgi:hypothetical protein